MMTIEEITKTVDEVIEENGYKRSFPVKLNNRLRTTMGRVCYRYGKIEKMEFSKILLECNEDTINDTLRHECAHVLVFLATGEMHGHDTEWKKWAIKCKANPSATSRDADYGQKVEALRAPYRYECYCADCGRFLGRYRTKRSRVMQHPENYRSNCCNGSLTIKEL